MRNLLLITIILAMLSGCAGSRDLSRTYPRIADAREAGHPIYIHHKLTSGANSVGGIDLWIRAAILGERTVKYVHFETLAYNAVGDRLSDDIRRSLRREAYATGPHRPNRIRNWRWKALWYNRSIKCIEIDEIRITYADDEEVTIERDEVDEIMSHARRPNSCAVDLDT